MTRLPFLNSQNFKGLTTTVTTLIVTIVSISTLFSEQSKIVPGTISSSTYNLIEQHIEELSSDRLEGRLTGSDGAQLAADYIVDQLVKIGAKPLQGHASFRIPFEFTAGIKDSGSTLKIEKTVTGENLEWTKQQMVQALPFSDSASVTGTAVFAGYGLTIPGNQNLSYDSYATLDVKDKIVIVLRYFPEDVDQDTRAILARYSGLRYKALAARERGASALLVVSGPRSPNAGQTIPLSFDAAGSSSGIVVASIGSDIINSIFETYSNDPLKLDELQKTLDTGNPHVGGIEFPNLQISLDVQLERQRETAYNIIGYLASETTTQNSRQAKSHIMLGAHYDHLGRGAHGNSLARSDERTNIHPGADDNASGVAAVLTVGSKFTEIDQHKNIVLAFWSGEELGLLGSTAFVHEPPFPLEALSAYINFDMVGRMRSNNLILQAVGTSPIWPRLIEQVNVPIGFNIRIHYDPYLPTDVSSLNQAEIPSLNFFTGSHEDYHRPTDVASAINYPDLNRIVNFGALLTKRLSDLDKAPLFTKVERVTQAGPGRDSVRAYTGTIPDYTTELEGLRLGGVVEGGPAEEAGLQKGDVVIEIAGQTITNIYDYTYALDSIKIDEPTHVIFIRDSKRLETTIVPRARR